MTMHILFLTPQLPYPPHQGTSLRNFGLLRAAAQAGHDVTLLSFQEPGQPNPQDTPLARLCHDTLTVPAPRPRTKITRALQLVFSGEADVLRRLRSGAFNATLRRLLAQQRFDIVHIEGIEMARYRPPIKAMQPHAALIYDAHNAEYDLQKRVYMVARAAERWVAAAYSYVQWQRLMSFERTTCRAVRQVLAVSQADAQALRALSGAPVQVIPNGIDTEAYIHTPTKPVDLGKAVLVFTGKMDYRPNVDAVLWFADAVFPRVRAMRPEARFVVVGQKPHARLARLKDMPGVTLTGWVPEIKPYLHAASVYVTPLRMGSGTRFKVLQAMASGVPVVSTSLGAEGIKLTAGQDILLADNAADFADAVLGLLGNPARRAAIAEAARAVVCRRYDWSVITPPLLELYTALQESATQ